MSLLPSALLRWALRSDSCAAPAQLFDAHAKLVAFYRSCPAEIKPALVVQGYKTI
jgi:hypothetical protein